MCHTEKDPNKEEESNSIDFTEITGGFGPWQLGILSIVFFCGIPGSWNTFAITFYAPNIDYWCVSNNSYNLRELRNWSTNDESKYTNISQCEQLEFINNDSSHLVETIVACTEWEYDKSFYHSTILEQWNLVCDREWLISLAKSLYMSGSLVAVLVLGYISDRCGRRLVMRTCLFILLTAMIICTFSTSFTMFLALRFFIPVGSHGIFAPGFVLLMETVASQYRTILGMVIQIGWSVGFILFPAIVWLFRDWLHIHIFITACCLPLIVILWFVPESPRWLLIHKRFEETKVVVSEACRKNRKNITDIEEKVDKIGQKIKLEEENNNRESKNSFLDLLKFPILRNYTLKLYFTWFVNAFIYFGLSLNTNDLSGDPFINFVISGAVEFPAYIIAIIVVKHYGRRLPITTTMVAAGVTCFLILAIPEDILWLKIATAMLGKLCICASFSILFVYSAEVFPTVVRNIGVGSCEFFGKVGSIVAPFVKELGQATHPAVPIAVYGGLSIAAGSIVLFLPETSNKNVLDTLEQAKEFSRKHKKNSHSLQDILTVTPTTVNSIDLPE